jgi:REP element-mobilizing transposase RayT
VDPWKDPDLKVTMRNLPHLESAGATYFVTFRCRKGVLLDAEAKDQVLSALRFWDETRIYLDAAVVMPDHVHAIFRLAAGRKLSKILESVKSFSSRRVEKLFGTSGPLWLDESFDHIIRHEDEWEQKIHYIRQNPVTKGLVSAPEHYQWTYVAQHHRPGDLCHKD